MQQDLLRDNQLIINGRSTADFPFLIAVEDIPAPQKARKKDKVFEEDMLTGYLKQSVNAYAGVEHSFNLYLHGGTKKQLRAFKTFIGDSGWFTTADETDVKYYYEQVKIEFSEMDAVGGYVCELTFLCQPFAYETEKVITLGSVLENHTNAPMYPRLEIRGNTSNQTFIQIGNQRMTFKSLNTVIYIECQFGKQDVWGSGGRKLNHETRGDFFEIPPGRHTVQLGPGITSIKMTTRWGWR